MRNMQEVYIHTVHKKLMRKGTAKQGQFVNVMLLGYFAYTVDKLRTLNPRIVTPF